jgi:hypothetical protein
MGPLSSTPSALGPRGDQIALTVTPPLAPWRMSGSMHLALCRATEPRSELPLGLRALFRWHRVVALVRYLEGTLQYDELIIGRLARRGLKVGIFVDHIWVNSAESVAGGRLFWGLPKELAEFTWVGDQVKVRDLDGDIAELLIDQTPATAPPVPMVAPGFGVRSGALLYSLGRLNVRLKRSSLRIVSWAPRFASISVQPSLGFDASPFKLVIDEGAPVG